MTWNLWPRLAWEHQDQPWKRTEKYRNIKHTSYPVEKKIGKPNKSYQEREKDINITDMLFHSFLIPVTYPFCPWPDALGSMIFAFNHVLFFLDNPAYELFVYVYLCVFNWHICGLGGWRSPCADTWERKERTRFRQIYNEFYLTSSKVLIPQQKSLSSHLFFSK